MFPTSTQKKYWTFRDESELTQLRQEMNRGYVHSHMNDSISVENAYDFFLSPQEERLISKHFEFLMKEFCNRFQPPMPKYVLGTSLCYFKRFYVHNSVMDYHPRDIMLTCVYLASKVEEFNVSIGQFVGNLKGDREKYSDTILGFELLLMQKLHYHLTVHNPYRPLEGLFIDLKTRSKCRVADIEKLRQGAEEFLDKSLNSDVCLVFPPSQLALCAILTTASKESLNLDSYITGSLMSDLSPEQLKHVVVLIKKIKYMVRNQENLSRDHIQVLMKKLEGCRNNENNPESEIYKKKMEEMFEDDDSNEDKHELFMEKERQEQQALLGM